MAVNAQCVDDCAVSGGKQCRDGGYQVCGAYDADPCLDWSPITNCTEEGICSEGICYLNSLKQCRDGGYQYCKIFENGTCVEWAAVIPCGSGKKCEAGNCVSSKSLAGFCTANYLKKCYDGDVYWHDSCGGRGEIAEDCGSNKICESGKCVSSCRNECLFPGFKRCIGFVAYQECGNYDDDSCLDWSRVVACSGQKTCIAGICIGAAPSDKQAPLISKLSPAGVVGEAKIVISGVTDEPASCRFDFEDIDYELMKNSLAAQEGVRHNAAVNLPDYGVYTYYLRCQDAAGNKSAVSAKASFSYERNDSAPRIEGVAPQGVVYQREVGLSFLADADLICRYSTADADYDRMPGLFLADDAKVQRAIAVLGDFGVYNYYVRCRDKSGKTNNASALISFEYKNPDEVNPAASGGVVSATSAAELICEKYTIGQEDNNCESLSDCVCDADCGIGSQTDPDCALAKILPKNTGMAAVIVILLLSAVFVFVFLKKKSRIG